MSKTWRNILISLFVILWTGVFHYESTRFFFLNPLFGRELPKLKFLYPPAGWIMFFQVTDGSGYVEVYGRYHGRWQNIDPHDIFRTRFVGFDNIHRGVLSGVSHAHYREPFCRYLRRRFPDYEAFEVRGVDYPSLIEDPLRRYEGVIYACP